MASDPSPLAELRDIRAAPYDPSALVTDGLAALAIGLALAMTIAAVARVLRTRRLSREQAALSRLATSRSLPPEDRIVAQARLLHECGESTRPLRADLKDALYRKNAAFDADAFDARIVNELKARRG